MTELTDETLEEIIGVTAMREYKAAPEWDQPKIRAWAVSLRNMSDEDFVADCSVRVLDSASVQRFKGDWEGTHARASACYTESKRRWKAAGHAKDCTGDNLYVEGYNRAYRSQGHTPHPWEDCTCGIGNTPFGRDER